MKSYRLDNGVFVPSVALGTWQMDENEAYHATLAALRCGYRHIDTAYAYHNEEAVGRAIKDSGIPRDEIFVTTKLPAEIKTYEGAMEYFSMSLRLLGLDYLDLYLIHAPWPWNEQGKDCMDGNVDVFSAFIKLYQEKKVRSIGVSNFHPDEIETLIEKTGVVPMVNQIRFFVGNIQKEVYDYCLRKNILVEAYSPLATGKLLEDENLLKMARRYSTSAAKILLQYCLEKHTLPIVKSVHEDRIRDNLDLPFYLSCQDVGYLDSIANSSLRKPYRY